MNYTIDIEWFDEGGYCQFYPLVNETHKGFKEFKSKNDAEQAFSLQNLLAKYKLAPQTYSDIIRVPVKDTNLVTNYGFVTHIADHLTPKPIKRWTQKHLHLLDSIQDLVDKIRQYTRLNFWDCHQENVGWIDNYLVCIDTGKESFEPDSDAWGLGNPGPRCYYCDSYICSCEENV